MSGIYIHIPFCRRACNYCNFHFSTSLSLQKDFTSALLLEIDLQRNYLQEPVSTIYFGGGTPSLMLADDLAVVLKKLS
ncbi:MAG TPA: radical SAM protein, partial [Segetibacter sp.]